MKPLEKKLTIVLIVMTTVLICVCVCAFCKESEPVERLTISAVTTSTKREEETKKVERSTFPTSTTYRRYETEVAKTETVPSMETAEQATADEVPLFKVGSKVLDVDVQAYLYGKLESYGIEYWMPYAIMQAYQECSFDFSQVTPHAGENNNDCGLFQFKQKWWPWYQAQAGYEGKDIMNPYDQIDVYAWHIANWLNNGCTESNVLSNWYTGGQGWCQEYVDCVMSHQGKLSRIN